MNKRKKEQAAKVARRKRRRFIVAAKAAAVVRPKTTNHVVLDLMYPMMPVQMLRAMGRQLAEIGREAQARGVQSGELPAPERMSHMDRVACGEIAPGPSP